MNAAPFGYSGWAGMARRRAARSLVLTLALSLGATAPALGDIRILSSGGGSVGEYLNFFARSGNPASALLSMVLVSPPARSC